MNLDSLNRWLTLAANLGVLVGVVFVAYEVRQNTEFARSNTRLEIAHDSFLPALAIAADESLAAALVKQEAGEGVSAVERQRLITLVYATNVIYENVYFQYRAGLLTDDQWQGFLRAIEFTRQGSTNPTYWIPELFSDEYRQLVQEIDARMAP